MLKRSKTEKLQQICTAVQHQKNSEALALIQSSPELRNTALASHLKNQERDKALIQRLNQALLQQNYSQALSIIQEAEQNGEASADILKLKDLPYALQALQLFCVRMPWEDARSLQKNWSFLAQHQEVLKESPAFLTFRQEQFNLLKSFRQEASQEEIALFLTRIDGFCAGSRYQEAWQTALQMKRKYPMHEFSRMVSGPRSRTEYFTQVLGTLSSPSAPGDSSAAFELALALNWQALSPEEQNKGCEKLKELPRKETVTGILLNAAAQKKAPALLAALSVWQKTAGIHQKLPKFFQDSLQETFSCPDSFPGIFPILHLISRLPSMEL